MNTPLQELIDVLMEYDSYELNNVRQLAESLLQKESSHTEEIAIGFSHYAEKEGFDYSLAHKIWIGVDNVTKTDKELFNDYLEYLKTI